MPTKQQHSFLIACASILDRRGSGGKVESFAINSTSVSSPEFKILFCYWLKKYCCVGDQHARFGDRHTKSMILVCRNRKSVCRASTHPPTQQVFAVCATRRVPLRTPFFTCVVIFRRNYFPVGVFGTRRVPAKI
jgi:hypothetical protein